MFFRFSCGGINKNMRNFFIRTFLRRPLFMVSILLICLILSGRYPSGSDPDGMKYCAADGRHLFVSGIVEGRGITANGYRLILDHLSFPEHDSGRGKDGNSSHSVLQSVVQELNQALSPSDRLQVFLSDGTGTVRFMYGEMEEEDTSGLWENASAREDQTGIFEAVRIGDRISLYGICSQPEKATNPGQFDSRSYYLARRIVLKMRDAKLKGHWRRGRELLPVPDSAGGPDSGEIASAGPASSFLSGIGTWYCAYRNLICDLRVGMQKGLLSAFGPQDASQAAAFVLGDGSGLDSGTKNLFRSGGLSWLVCVSSLHISLLGMMLFRLLRSRGISFAVSSAAAFFAVGSYALLTDYSLSAQRALVTFALWLGAQIFGRTRDTLTSLSAAACVILIRQPYALRDSSFLMSFVCILSLEYLTPAMIRILRVKRAMPRRFCSTFCLWLGSLPAVLWFFYQTSPYASMLYPVMLPLMSLFLGFGILGSLGGCLYFRTGISVFLIAGKTFSWPCRIMLGAMRGLCGMEQELPGSVLILGRPAVWQMILYYAVLAFFVIRIRKWEPGKRKLSALRLGPAGNVLPAARFQNRPLSRIRILSAGILSALVLMICLRLRPEFRYTCLDIGQGSCNLIEHNGCAYLFDAGSSSVKDVWQYRISSTLKYYGIRKVDMVFLSHGDTDHINGIEQMLSQYHENLIGQNAQDVTIGRILVPDLPVPDERISAILAYAGEHGIKTGCVSEGAALTQSGMAMDILGPSPLRITGEANQDCIVMMVRYRNLKILLTGDLEKEAEQMFVRSWQGSSLFSSSGKADKMILAAGHHGSRYATSRQLLDLVKPDLVLISCGKNNRYGHPARQMLERVIEAGVPYRRTDLEGAISVQAGF